MQFGGSGRALGGTSSAASSGGGWLGGGRDSSPGSTAASKDREAVAARRLAALSNQHGSGQSGGMGSEGGSAQSDLQRLQVSECKRQVMADAACKRIAKIGCCSGIDSQPAAVSASATTETSLLIAATNHPSYSAG